jgi:hypothetical protein
MFMLIYDFAIKIIMAGGICLIQTDSSLVGQGELIAFNQERLEALANTSFCYDLAHAQETIYLGQYIYQELLPKIVRIELERAREIANEQAAILRLLLKFGRDSLPQQIPWELMHDGHRALALDPVTPIVRYVEQQNEIKSLRVKKPVRVLFTTASPSDQQPLNLLAEEKLFRRALRPFETSIRLDVQRNISFGRLRQLLIHAQEGDSPFHIWHHCGHSAYAAEGFALILEEGRKSQFISTDALVPVISHCPALRLAVLDVCHGAAPGGVAPALAAINVPATIGFRDQIYDRVALDFTETLYGNLLRLPVDLALKQATRALFDPIRPLDWALPLLFLRTTDASFFTA